VHRPRRGRRVRAQSLENTVETTLPVGALTILGIVLAVLGLFVAGNIQVVVIGLVAVFGAGLLQVAGSRR
jgi:hypothetical protein